MAEFASRATGNTALGLSIGALGLEAVRGGVGNLLNGILGGGNNTNEALLTAVLMGAMAGSKNDCDHGYGRYDAGKDAEIAELRTEIKLRDANTYTMGEVGKLRDYMEHRFDHVERELGEQKVYNATNTATLSCMGQQIGGIQGVLAAITKTVIPKDVICPEVMARYNSWQAPTETAQTGN